MRKPQPHQYIKITSVAQHRLIIPRTELHGPFIRTDHQRLSLGEPLPMPQLPGSSRYRRCPAHASLSLGLLGKYRLACQTAGTWVTSLLTEP